MFDATLKGTITAIITPFKDDFSVDFDAFEKLLAYQIDSGIEAIVVAGSTGESATLNDKERLALIIKAVEFSNGRVPIIAGTGTNDTKKSIDLTLLAKECGADAVLLVCPYYNKPTQEGLFNHFLAIAEAVDIPQILYNVPGRSGVNITAETQVRLANAHKNIVATKEASGDLEQMAQIMMHAPKGFALYCGDDALAVPAISIGTQGVISVLSNSAPKLFGDCVRFALDGKFAEANKLHYKLLDMMGLNFVESNPIPIKTALSLMGYCDENFRLPLVPMTDGNKKILKKELKKLGLMK